MSHFMHFFAIASFRAMLHVVIFLPTRNAIAILRDVLKFTHISCCSHVRYSVPIFDTKAVTNFFKIPMKSSQFPVDQSALIFLKGYSIKSLKAL